MKPADHVNAVLDRVLERRPWLAEGVIVPGGGRYARVRTYRGSVSLQ
ncbi:MAG: hypothetical protein JWM57_2025, partial [Phycisphaerales bacterium]|nr:hypothetical protein [Phycisphaerales bacterium]